MSDMTAHRGLGYSYLGGKWGWFVALGVGLILAGLFAFVDTLVFTLIGTLFIGASLLVGGVFQVVHVFATKGWSAFMLNLLCGLLTIAAGLLIMAEPLEGALVITLFLLAALVVGGVVRIAIAFSHREVEQWWMMAIGGLISIALGVMLYVTLPWSSLILLGLIVGIELLVQGVSWLQFGLALRRRGQV